MADWNSIMTYGGLAAAGGLVASTWSQIRSMAMQVWSLMFVTVVLRPGASVAAENYIWKTMTPLRTGPRTFKGETQYIAKRRRSEMAIWESAGNEGRFFYRGRTLLWVQKEPHGQYSEGHTIKLTYIRGTVDVEQLLREAALEYDRRRFHRKPGHRALVYQCWGTAQRFSQESDRPRGSSSSSGTKVESVDAMLAPDALLTHSFDELGHDLSESGNPDLADLALDEAAHRLIRDVRYWAQAKDWYEQRKIPWRRGYLLAGPPGNGKTSLIRALANELDFPVKVFHLNTMYDHELQEYWDNMTSEAPCIALIEDIDAVFHKRETVAGKVTFGTFLNCVEGVSTAPGVLLVITTNHPEKLDSALSAGGEATRPGRIDRVLHMGPPDEAGLRHIASRILQGDPELQEEALTRGQGMSGAQFQLLCGQLAQDKFWEQAHQELEHANSRVLSGSEQRSELEPALPDSRAGL